MSKRTRLKIEGIVFVIITFVTLLMCYFDGHSYGYMDELPYFIVYKWFLYGFVLFCYFYDFTREDNDFGFFEFKNLRRISLFADNYGSKDKIIYAYLHYYKRKEYSTHPINKVKRTLNPKNFCEYINVLDKIRFSYGVDDTISIPINNNSDNRISLPTYRNDIATKMLSLSYIIPDDLIIKLYDESCYYADKTRTLKINSAENCIFEACKALYKELINQYYREIKYYSDDYDKLIEYSAPYLNKSEIIKEIAIDLYVEINCKKKSVDYENFSDYINDYGEVKEKARKIFENYKKSYKDELNK